MTTQLPCVPSGSSRIVFHDSTSEGGNNKREVESFHSLVTIHSSESEVEKSCGLWKWRPNCLRHADSIRIFLIVACLVSFAQSALSGYYASQVTTLEKRFAVGSSIIGVVNSFFELGYICFVVFVSYAGGRGHVPLYMANGLFLMCLGTILWTSPHFIFTPAPITSRSVDTVPFCLPPDVIDRTNPQTLSTPPSVDAGYAFLPILFIAQVLIGGGSSPILTLAPPFIDDHVKPDRAPPMIAAQYAAAAMGPVFGFGLGGLLLRQPADLGRPSPFKPTDPEWIGAWWLGFLILGSIYLSGGFVLLCFPRHLHDYCKPRRKRASNREIQRNGSAGSVSRPGRQLQTVSTEGSLQTAAEDASDVRIPWSGYSGSFSRERQEHYLCSPNRRCKAFKSGNWTKFSNTLYSLFHNKVYIAVSLCICSEMFLIIGFSSFLPKYLEMEYHISKSLTSIIAGGLIIPSGAIGILAGGLILNRFKFRRACAARFIVFVNLIIAILLSLFFFLGCHNPSIAGITSDYPVRDVYTSSSKYSLQVKCNQNCPCSENTWFPVCDRRTGVTFISPCFAGCNVSSNTYAKNGEVVYQHCSCLPREGKSEDRIVYRGECPLDCAKLPFFIPALVACLFLTGVIQNPLIMVTMRSVDRSERSFALGLQFVIIRVLAYIPSPIVFGRVIDGACRFWRHEFGRRGDCAFVDVRHLNIYLAGLSVVVKGCGFIFYFFLIYFIRTSPSEDAYPERDTMVDPRNVEKQVVDPAPLTAGADDSLQSVPDPAQQL
ncbi:unnamed protein product [Calicophoron daubneyi]|uniref:Solute carrier organic anion transporter family member n=1 Tax=Calicophoron daubneyi TaxID=300641 RepID=A0AAV2TQ92_CALDB